MSNGGALEKTEPGSIVWVDLTVPDAETLKSFYSEVTGWRPVPVAMGEYKDYAMNTPGSDQATAGVCNARGTNAGLPAQWLIYIAVNDIDAAMTRCEELGGSVVVRPKGLGKGRYCVIRDPAGAVCALYQEAVEV